MKADIRNQDGRYIVSVRGVDLRSFKTLKNAAIYADDSAQEDFEDKYLPDCLGPSCPPAGSKPVVCVEAGIKFSTISAAAEWTGVGKRLGSASISRAAKEDSRTAFGFHWRYA